MRLSDIMEDVLIRSSRPLTIGQLTDGVQNHHAWKGRSRGRQLAQRILREAQGDPQRFTLRRGGRTIYIGLNQGKVLQLGKHSRELAEGLIGLANPQALATLKVVEASGKIVKDIADGLDQSD
jgi:hypothetical protein